MEPQIEFRLVFSLSPFIIIIIIISISLSLFFVPRNLDVIFFSECSSNKKIMKFSWNQMALCLERSYFYPPCLPAKTCEGTFRFVPKDVQPNDL